MMSCLTSHGMTCHCQQQEKQTEDQDRDPDQDQNHVNIRNGAPLVVTMVMMTKQQQDDNGREKGGFWRILSWSGCQYIDMPRFLRTGVS